MLSFVIAEDLWIKTSYPFNEVTAVFLLNNPRYHHTSHSDEPLSYHVCMLAMTDGMDGILYTVFSSYKLCQLHNELYNYVAS